MSKFKIILGPLLGVESGTDYTVCILINHQEIIDYNNITLHIDSHVFHSSQKASVNGKYTFLRFEFTIVIPEDSDQTLRYCLKLENEKLYSSYDACDFEFIISHKNKNTSIVLVSCNGTDINDSISLPLDDYNGWEKIRQNKPDLLILGGDQVYADIIWKKLPESKKVLKSKLKMINDNLKAEIDRFYCELYIQSWTIPQVAKTLATIPNIMTWDDHDIIDGYGSLPDEYQNSDLIKYLFDTAKKYYSFFQIRGKNKTLISPQQDFSYILKWRNYEFVAPDTRSKRSRKQVLDGGQYNLLRSVLTSFPPAKEKTKNIVVFILPVPIAHRKFDTWLEKAVETIFSFVEKLWASVIKRSLDDDMLDHWEHHAHKDEQLKMLDLIFDVGLHKKCKNLIIMSGDVHFAGATKIEKKVGKKKYTATQMISSPIVNNPFSARIGNLLAKYSSDINLIGDVTMSDFKEFGNYKNKMLTKRNFILIKHRDDNGVLTCSLFHEPWDEKPYYRTVNNFY